jgi:hypothetical protein
MQDLGELLHDRTSRGSDAPALHVSDKVKGDLVWCCSAALHVSDKVKGDLDAIEVHVAEARHLLLIDNQSD